MTTRESLERLLKIRLKKYQYDYNIFINAAMLKEESWHKHQETKKRLEELDRTEFEGSKAAPKEDLAASIEKVFGAQGLELVQRQLARSEEHSEEPSD